MDSERSTPYQKYLYYQGNEYEEDGDEWYEDDDWYQDNYQFKDPEIGQFNPYDDEAEDLFAQELHYSENRLKQNLKVQEVVVQSQFTRSFKPIEYNFGTYAINQNISYEHSRILVESVDFCDIFQLNQEREIKLLGKNENNHYVRANTDKNFKLLKSIVKIKRDFELGGILEIWSFNNCQEYKIEIQFSQIHEIIKTKKGLGIRFKGSPAFFINRNLNKGYQLSLAVLEQTNNKVYERVQNQTLDNEENNELICKYLKLQNGGLIIEVSGNDLIKISQSIAKYQSIVLKEDRNLIDDFQLSSEFVKKIFEEHSVSEFFEDLKSLGRVVDSYCLFQIQFSLISMLLQSQFVEVEHLQSFLEHLTKEILGKAKNKKEKQSLFKKISEVLSNISKEDINLKARSNRPKSLVQIFTKKFRSLIKQQSVKMKKNQQAREKNNIITKSIKITPSGMIPCGWKKDMRSRMNRYFRQNDFQFLKVEVVDDDIDKSKIYKGGQNLNVFMWSILRSINILGVKFDPLGWTQSQLKENSLWYIFQSKLEERNVLSRTEVVNFLGQFDDIKNPAKKAARIGQNLVGGRNVKLQNVNLNIVKDDMAGKYKFTDGVGKISQDLVERICKQLQIKGSVFQIRYLGLKGLLVLNRELPPNTIEGRQSMQKFKCKNPDAKQYIDILQYNFYKTGYLNRQIIILLEANNIPKQNLVQVQEEFMQSLKEEVLHISKEEYQIEDFDLVNCFKDRSFHDLDSDFPKIDNIGEIVKQLSKQKNLDLSKQPTMRGILLQKLNDKLQYVIKKSRIRVEKSAKILGIIDDYGILEENEIYCTLIKDECSAYFRRKKTKSSLSQLIKKLKKLKEVNKNYDTLNEEERDLYLKWKEEKKKRKQPKQTSEEKQCLQEILVCTQEISDQEEAKERFAQIGKPFYFQDLFNCIIFPKKGSIPLTSKISGSDLDGDIFFITWDERLIPQKSQQPLIIDDIKVSEPTVNICDYDEMVRFFCEFLFNNKLGRIANAHLAKADQTHPESKDCISLCYIHSVAVDYPKKGYAFKFPKELKVIQFPQYMEKADKPKREGRSVIGLMYKSAIKYFNSFFKEVQLIPYKLGLINILLNINFSQEEIKEACKVILRFNRQICELKKMYRMKRESEIYNLTYRKRFKETRPRALFINNLRMQYFLTFFDNLHIEKPFQFLQKLKESERTHSISEEQVEQQKRIIKKLALWYLISYVELIEIDHSKKRQVQWMANVRKCLGETQVKVMGLCWFCVPYLTYRMLRNLQKCK